MKSGVIILRINFECAAEFFIVKTNYHTTSDVIILVYFVIIVGVYKQRRGKIPNGLRDVVILPFSFFISLR